MVEGNTVYTRIRRSDAGASGCGVQGPRTLGLALSVAIGLFASGCTGPAATPPPDAASSPSYAAVPSLPPSPLPTVAPLPKGVLASIQLDSQGAPGAVVNAFGSIWVPEHRENTLNRIDAATNRVTARVDMGEGACFPPQVGFGRLFITGCEDGIGTVVVDPAVNRVVATSQCGAWLAFGAGSIWAGGRQRSANLQSDDVQDVGVHQAPGPDLRHGIWVRSGVGRGHGKGPSCRIDPAPHRVTATLVAGSRGRTTGTSIRTSCSRTEPRGSRVT